MNPLRLLIEILMLLLIIAFIAKDCRGVDCEGVYLECDSVYYFGSDTSKFLILPHNDTLYGVTHEMLWMHQTGQCECFDTSTFKIEPDERN